MDPQVRRWVKERAGDACEYCRLPQLAQPWLKYHIEHIIPRQHQGGDDVENLALACPHCNRQKGPNLASIDPMSGEVTPLFHPRTQRWIDHFALVEHRILGQTAVGRVTVGLLQMNAPSRVQLRIELSYEGQSERG